jgi:hypothetical protein
LTGESSHGSNLKRIYSGFGGDSDIPELAARIKIICQPTEKNESLHANMNIYNEKKQLLKGNPTHNLLDCKCTY